MPTYGSSLLCGAGLSFLSSSQEWLRCLFFLVVASNQRHVRLELQPKAVTMLCYGNLPASETISPPPETACGDLLLQQAPEDQGRF